MHLMPLTVISGADIVLSDRVLHGGSIVFNNEGIVAVESRAIDGPAGSIRLDGRDLIVCPGFVDVHVHGVEGVDVLDGAGAVSAVAARLPRFGVTAFCPTSVACPPDDLARFLNDVAAARAASPLGSAAVLPAHLESNFISPEFKGAQPARCLRVPAPRPPRDVPADEHGDFDAAAILRVLDARPSVIGIVTIAPELDGGMSLLGRLVAAGHRVSLGHTGATYEVALAAIDAGACHATHLFNRMSALNHRAPGVAGAVLGSTAVAAEIICDGFHVHPALVKLALSAKGIDRVMAITDGTAGSGMPVGTRTRLGGMPIVVTARTAELEDGTLAGSVLTMDGALRMLVEKAGVSLVDAARLCASTPAREMGLMDTGVLTPGAAADLVALDRDLRVCQTFVRGWPALEHGPLGARLSS
jgi:N-acetylglucosamine-6-phosphate deacetylase